MTRRVPIVFMIGGVSVLFTLLVVVLKALLADPYTDTKVVDVIAQWFGIGGVEVLVGGAVYYWPRTKVLEEVPVDE